VAGGLTKITEAGAVLAGGHTIDDDEPKFGLSVTGIVHPQKYWTNAGARPGDSLVLTKPIGSGVIFNANLKGWVTKTALDECIATITDLNRVAAEIMQRFDIHAATDITGFGLAGHAFEMARGSRVRLEISMKAVPLMKEALEMYKRGVSTKVNIHNRQLVENHMRFEKDLPAWHVEILFDPQTSGGLLVALPEQQAWKLVNALHRQGVGAACLIGRTDKPEEEALLIIK